MMHRAKKSSQQVDEKKEEIVGKRKRKKSKCLQSPYLVKKPNKRAKRSTRASKIMLLENSFACNYFIDVALLT